MEIVNVRFIGNVADQQRYDPKDTGLITTTNITTTFGNPLDYIEYFIKDLNGNLIAQNYNATSYSPGGTVNSTNGSYTALKLDPEADVRANRIDRGSTVIKYNFYNKLLSSSPLQTFWIKEISPSRTEIKVARQDLSNTALLEAFNAFNNTISNTNYYPDFLLNFGQDREIIGVNAVYVEQGGIGYIIFKLYEPLPTDYDLKSQFWVVKKTAESVEFEVTIEVEAEAVVDQNRLRGPNYKVNLNQKQNQTTPYYNYNTLFTTSVSSSYQQLQSMLDERGININVNYSNFENFIHFSSATERLLNFEYKVRLIEAYNQDIASLNNLSRTPTSVVNTNVATLQQSIDNIITKFDGYEYYLYFTSASTAWPKQTDQAPYTLYSVTSSQALDWLGDIGVLPTAGKMSMLYSASLYDNLNKDNLQYTLPAYIREDAENQPYMTFINMVGQHFDNIWIYYKDVSNRYSAENNPDIGISMDMVANALRGFGIELYTNSNISDNIYYSLFGINETGSSAPVTSAQYAQVNTASSSLTPTAGNDWLSQSLYLPPFGAEKINNYVTTLEIDSLPPNQLDKEIYKRLYHNLPYLLKTKGTQRGIKALIACYGIPNTILTVNEFGGGDIYTEPGIQQVQNEKVFIGTNLSISSSLLSPYVTNQYFQNNTERGSLDVEIGFSPADSINADISSSLGNFSIMQYIGAPNLQYSSSYEPLVALENQYFDANYTTRYNVWDFIRIIKFYNNSLFKMVKDFVPARANLSSGIIVKSHTLERNKYARHEPIVEMLDYSQSIDTAFITASDAPVITRSTAFVESVQTPIGIVDVDNVYGFEKYTGEFSGSILAAAPDYFPQIENSSITAPWTGSTPGSRTVFTTYSISYLYQNVSGSPKSTRFFDLDYNGNQLKPTNYNLVTQSINAGQASLSNPYAPYAQIQDYNYYLQRSIKPRYAGSYLSGQQYNVYTVGDVSLGREPVINYYTDKLGYFTQVTTSSFLPGKVNVTMTYLADVSGGLFELNQNNRHWVDVQNIYKAGTELTVKQFNNRQYSNQVATDGIKPIYSSGYSYTPMLYFGSSDLTVYLEFAGSGSLTEITARNSGLPNNYINGAPTGQTPYYPLIPTTTGESEILNLFDYVEIGNDLITPGSTTTAMSYMSPITTLKSFNIKFDVDVRFQTFQQEAEFIIDVYRLVSGNREYVAGFGSDVIQFESQDQPERIYKIFSRTVGGQIIDDPSGPIYQINGPFTVTKRMNDGTLVGTSPTLTIGNPQSYIKVQSFTATVIGTSTPVTRQGIVEKSADIADNYEWLPYYNQSTGGGNRSDTWAAWVWVPLGNTSNALPVYTPRYTSYGSTQTIDYTTYQRVINPNDPIYFSLRLTGATTTNFTASISAGNSSILTTAGTTATANGVYVSANQTSYDPFITAVVADPATNTGRITLNPDISQYWKYRFVPSFESASVIYTSSLYDTYGDVNASFDPQVGDTMVLYNNVGMNQIMEITAPPYINGGNLILPTYANLVTNWTQDPTKITKFLLLKKFPDEQNIILDFIKKPGATSFGFVIPNSVTPAVVDNINTLQAQVQSQILTNQTTGG